MQKSALEKEIIEKIYDIRILISTHDRGVFLGFFLSLFPLFPVAFFGLIISAVNHVLWKNGKLEIHEASLIRWGMILGIINTIIGMFLFLALIEVFSNVHMEQLYAYATEKIYELFAWIKSWIGETNHSIST